jgi:hypothetical protein
MLVLSSVRAGVGHLVDEVSVVVGYAAPPRGSSGTEEVGVLAMSGDVIVPGAIGATAVLFVLFLCQGVVLCIFAIPRNSASHSSSQS